MFGDGREERLAAFDLELRLRLDPELQRTTERYEQRVSLARDEARRIGKSEVIARLVSSCPAYLIDLLESEDERFGDGALYERYARTFQRNFREQP